MEPNPGWWNRRGQTACLQHTDSVIIKSGVFLLRFNVGGEHLNDCIQYELNAIIRWPVCFIFVVTI